jgi:hypothetical protein
MTMRRLRQVCLEALISVLGPKICSHDYSHIAQDDTNNIDYANIAAWKHDLIAKDYCHQQPLKCKPDRDST